MKFSDINAIRLELTLLLATGFLLGGMTVSGNDWPRFLGPNQNGSLPTDSLPDRWPADGPTQRWQLNVGNGFAGPIVLADQVIVHHRVRNEEELLCLNAKDGKVLWRFGYPTAYRDSFGFDNGPRSTPTAAGNHVYSYGAQGDLYCVDRKTGKPAWNLNTMKAFSAPKGFFGIACSPLVDGDRVVVNVGSSQAGGIQAFDRFTGKPLWQASRDDASYSSPVVATIAGIRQAIVFDREGLKAVELSTGKIRSEFPWRPAIEASVNAASPIVRGNQVFLTTSYNTGALVLDLSQAKPRKEWSNDTSLSCHYGTPAIRDGYLYGFHGRQEWGAELRCVEWASGRVRWTAPNVAIGTASVVGDKLLILQENGELVLARARPERYEELDRAQILPSQVRAYPALANGTIYARSTKKLVAFDLQ